MCLDKVQEPVYHIRKKKFSRKSYVRKWEVFEFNRKCSGEVSIHFQLEVNTIHWSFKRPLK
jgi:hypothetical protein